MSLIKFIENYIPYDEEETRYKESFLQFIKTFPQNKWAERNNLIGHLTSTAWVVNKERTKVLMAFHNIYQSWAWLGGHNDGDLDSLHVARKEVEEESGLKEFKTVIETPFEINVMSVQSHIKRGNFVPTHLHYNPVYLFEADENELLQHKPDENSGLKWIPNEKVIEHCSEEHVKSIYKRVMEKVKKL